MACFFAAAVRSLRGTREIEYKELIVDNAAMQLVMRPETFDILLLPNLYGDIVSDFAAGLVGGLGIVPGANMGDNHAVFEAVHGSAPDIAGRESRIPRALMLSAVMMLRHLGEVDASMRLQTAIEQVYREGKCLPRTWEEAATTSQFTDAVCAALKALAPDQLQDHKRPNRNHYRRSRLLQCSCSAPTDVAPHSHRRVPLIY